MAANVTIEDSLHHLLKCNVCLEQVHLLKALPCQHTICLSCVKQLTVRKNRFKCAICNKENPVPNGGFDQLPDSLLTKQIADIIRQRQSKQSGKDEAEEAKDDKLDSDSNCSGRSAAVPPSSLKRQDSDSSPVLSPRRKKTKMDHGTPHLPLNTEDVKEFGSLDMLMLKRKLQETLESGKSLNTNMNLMMTHHRKVLEELPEQTRATKEAILAYQEKISGICQEKIKDVTKGQSDHATATQSMLDKYQPYVDQMKSVMEEVPKILKLLDEEECPPKAVNAAEKQLSDLKTLMTEVAKGWKDVTSYRIIRRGDSVRIRIPSHCTETKVQRLLNDNVTYSSVGIFLGATVKKIGDGTSPGRLLRQQQAMVIFPEKLDWIAPVGTVVKSCTKAQMPFEGDKVRVKESMVRPLSYWKGVCPKTSHGILKEIKFAGPKGDLTVIVDFPERKGWSGLYSQIELVPGCGLEAGDDVWVSRAIPEPSRGWAGVNGSSVGKIKHIEGPESHEEVTVDFPECSDWIGLATELELVRELQQGEKVQVKLSVKKPKLDWGGVTHEDIGELTNVNDEYENLGRLAEVQFPKRPKWTCALDEIEPVRYQPPSYDVSSPVDMEGDDDLLFPLGEVFLAAMINLLGASAT